MNPTDRPRKTSLAMKLQKFCGVDQEDYVDYRRRFDIPDPLYHFSTEGCRRLGGRSVRFFIGSLKKPRFSLFLAHPEKTSGELEDSMDAARETYDSEDIAVVFGEEVGGQFVYTNVPPRIAEMENRLGILKFNYRKQKRFVMTLKAFLIGQGAMGEMED